MTKPLSPVDYKPFEASSHSREEFFKIETFSDEKDRNSLTELIRENMKEFDLKEKALLATYQRLNDLSLHYSEDGNQIYFIREHRFKKPIACIGLGSFRGLPLSEKIGEIRDLVVQKNFRNRGLGRKLLKHCIKKAKDTGYKRLYLETSKYMTSAQKLFTQSGFEAVEELPKKDLKTEDIPCYYLLRDLQVISSHKTL